MKNTNEKINSVYNFTVDFINENGFPPSVREICANLNIKSTATVYSYLEKLKAQGLLDKSPSKKRALSLTQKKTTFKSVPLIGTVRAGAPIFAVENLEGYYPLPDELDAGGIEFALKVKGDSMKNAGILDNDIIVVRHQNTANNGDIVVALIDDSATVKRFFKRDNQIVLHPENETMQDMIYNDVQILGIVTGLMRKF